MFRKWKIKAIADEIEYFSGGKVHRAVAEAEADAFLKRRGFVNPFVHNGSFSSIGKKLAYKCMGKPYV